MADSFEQLRAEFLAETEDTLQNLQQDLNQLGEALNSNAVVDGPVDRVFRTTHSLKGVAGMFGLTRMSAVSHSLESVFESVRRGDVGLDPELLDLLHRGNEVLHALLAAAAAGEKEGGVAEAADVIHEIDAALAGRLPTDRAANRTVAEALDCLAPEERASVRRAIELGRNAVVVEAVLPEQGFEIPFRDLLTAIRNWGTVHGTVSGERLESDSTFRVQLVATGPPEIFGLMKIVGPLGGEVLVDESATTFPDIQDAEPSDSPGSEPDELPGPVEPEVVAYSPDDATGMYSGPEDTGSATAPVLVANADQRDAGPFERRFDSATPRLSTLRVPVGRVDRLMTELADLVQAKLQLDETADMLLEGTDRMSRTMLKQSLRGLDRHIRTIQDGVLGVRLVGLEPLFQKLERAFRDACRATGKTARLETSGESTELDKEIVEALAEPLLHLVRNAVDHGLESDAERRAMTKDPVGTVRLCANTEGSFTVVEVSDDGAGVDFQRVRERGCQQGLLDEGVEPTRAELLELLFHPGFTVKDTVTEISGRGVGLEAVRDSMEAVGGSIEIVEAEVGTVFRLRVPISLAITQALEVTAGGQAYMIPLSHVRRALHVRPDDLGLVADEPVFVADDLAIPVISLSDEPIRTDLDVVQRGVLLGLADRRRLLLVDHVGRRREIVVRSLGDLLPVVPGVSGCTELGDGRTVLILDPAALFKRGARSREMNS